MSAAPDWDMASTALARYEFRSVCNPSGRNTMLENRSVRVAAQVVAGMLIAVAWGCGDDGAAQRADASSSAANRREPVFDAGGTAAPSSGAAAPARAQTAGSDEPVEIPEGPEPAPQAGLHIQLETGALVGKQLGATREFLAIPYAKPPVGDLRFMPPEPAEAWTGIREATAFGPACPQLSNMLSATGPQDEDCLSLNVYAPDQVDRKLPVMVFIHGGAFVTGDSSQYDGKLLSEHSQVVVTINYRLSALGFFSHPALDVLRRGARSGNDGMRDQQLALRWVRANIGAFGGDRNQVTLFGESAGSISTCFHLVAPGSRKLAQRLIMQSGSCTIDSLGARSKLIADGLGMGMANALCPGEADIVACLRGKSADELVNWGLDQSLFGADWRPTVEGDTGVLPDTTERLLAKADTLPAFIIGTTKNEWGLFQSIGSPKYTTVDELKSAIESQFGEKAALVETQYSAASDDEANDVYVRLVSDLSFRCPTRTLARLASAKGADVYLYSFEQGTAFHAQELDYVFGGANLTSFGGGPPSLALTAAVQRYWTRFASTGDPNGGSDPNWPKFQTESDPHLVLVDPPAVSSGLAQSACDFWQSYFRDGGTVDLN
jgi:para-nitrobenzyl esterase